MISNEEASKRLAVEMLTLAKPDAAAALGLMTLPGIDFSMIGFHAQQCVEKCFKAVMALQSIEFPRSHDLSKLSHLLELTNLAVPLSHLELSRLTPYAVSSRYDLEREDLLDEEQAKALVTRALAWAGSLIYTD